MQKWLFSHWVVIGLSLIFINSITAMKRDNFAFGQPIFENSFERRVTAETLRSQGLEQLSKWFEIFLKGGDLGFRIRDSQGHDLAPTTPVIVMDENRRYCVGLFTKFGDFTYIKTSPPHRTIYLYVGLPGKKEMAYRAEEIWVSTAGFDALKIKS